MTQHINLKVQSLLEEMRRLGDEITQRLRREAVLIQILASVTSLVGVYIVITFKDDPMPILGLLLPPIIAIFSWLCSAEHIKIRREELYIREYIEKRVNELLGEDVLRFQHFLSGLLTPKPPLIVKIFSQGVFFFVLNAGALLLVFLECSRFNEVSWVSQSPVLWCVLPTIYSIMLGLNILAIFFAYPRRFW